MSDAAIANIVTGLVTITMTVIGFLTLWVKLKYGVAKAEEASNKATVVELKLDQNTAITRAGTEAATKNAMAAAITATAAKSAAESIDNKLNGGIDAAIVSAVRPIHNTLSDHAQQDEKNIAEIRDQFIALASYVHDRNHDLLNSLQVLMNQVNILIAMQEASTKVVVTKVTNAPLVSSTPLPPPLPSSKDIK